MAQIWKEWKLQKPSNRTQTQLMCTWLTMLIWRKFFMCFNILKLMWKCQRFNEVLLFVRYFSIHFVHILMILFLFVFICLVFTSNVSSSPSNFIIRHQWTSCNSFDLHKHQENIITENFASWLSIRSSSFLFAKIGFNLLLIKTDLILTAVTDFQKTNYIIN